MTLNTAEWFLTLIHRPDRPGYLVADPHRNVGIIGAILMDLSAEGKLTVKDGKLVANSASTKLSEVHMKVLRKVYDTARQKKVRYWISRFSQVPGKYRRGVFKELERKGVFRVEKKNFLFIPYLKATLLKRSLRDHMITELREIIFSSKETDEQNAMILGLFKACNACKVVSRNKEEQKRCKARLKDIIETNVISGGVGKVIQEMQAAVLVAIIATSAATTAATR